MDLTPGARRHVEEMAGLLSTTLWEHHGRALRSTHDLGAALALVVSHDGACCIRSIRASSPCSRKTRHGVLGISLEARGIVILPLHVKVCVCSSLLFSGP